MEPENLDSTAQTSGQEPDWLENLPEPVPCLSPRSWSALENLQLLDQLPTGLLEEEEDARQNLELLSELPTGLLEEYQIPNLLSPLGGRSTSVASVGSSQGSNWSLNTFVRLMRHPDSCYYGLIHNSDDAVYYYNQDKEMRANMNKQE